MFFENRGMMHAQNKKLRTLLHMVIALALLAGPVFGAARRHHRTVRKTAVSVRAKAGVSRRTNAVTLTRKTVRSSRRWSRRTYYSPWTEPTYADSTMGDDVDGDDLIVRRAAVEALGPYNGTVVVVDPNTGRILTMVNQRVALKSGFQPCSTVKVSVALAALSEGVIARKTMFRLTSGNRMDLTYALAHSNNAYFANLGIKLGYERYAYYARLLGFGEKAGLNIQGEQAGLFPPAPPKNGGMGMLTSFGEEISLTPLELAAQISAISNGGTLYWLQYPRNQAEVETFVPRVKRQLDIAQYIPDIKPGMMGAVEYGTARRAVYNPEAPICGKTGTCTGGTTHLGWFGSFSDFGQNKIVTVVLLTGGYGVSGPTAAQIAGSIYRKLSDQGYFAKRPVFSPALMLSK